MDPPVPGPIFFRWIDHKDGSQDVAEDKNTPCGTMAKLAQGSQLNRIIGGHHAVEHSHPWIARMALGCAKSL